MKNDRPVWSDPERLGGRVCFLGTRVPVDALFDNLEAGLSVGEFLEEFEGVTRAQAIAVLKFADAGGGGGWWKFGCDPKRRRNAALQ